MIFFYHSLSGSKTLRIDGELYRHIFKSRRSSKDETVKLSNLQDWQIYHYKIDGIGKKEANLTLFDVEKRQNIQRGLHLVWCIIDTKSIEKTLPVLNELGVGKITFVYCQRSQKSYKINLEKLNKILQNSCGQCGRVDMMEIEVVKSLEEVLLKYDDLAVVDFGGKSEISQDLNRFLIGPEGGFSEKERKRLKEFCTISFKTDLVLKSESAAMAICSKKI
jgi:16S rRNA (uracil1498-N3)-methyltransferase